LVGRGAAGNLEPLQPSLGIDQVDRAEVSNAWHCELNHRRQRRAKVERAGERLADIGQELKLHFRLLEGGDVDERRPTHVLIGVVVFASTRGSAADAQRGVWHLAATRTCPPENELGFRRVQLVTGAEPERLETATIGTFEYRPQCCGIELELDPAAPRFSPDATYDDLLRAAGRGEGAGRRAPHRAVVSLRCDKTVVGVILRVPCSIV